MNTREAVQYLKKVFGNERGYAAVAYKDKDDGWGERSFAWPKQARELVLWAKGIDGNVFICPALRSGKDRIKGNMIDTDWLWADVDMQAMGATRREEVWSRVEKIGTYVVLSGTGDNVHVYVKLKRKVDAREHEYLNTGLRNYLSADNKQADNSLLRLPGTYNYKPENGPGGSRVRPDGGHGRSVAPETLRKAAAWRAVHIPSRDGSDGVRGDWKRVDVTSLLKGRVKTLCRMPGDEAIGRYGSRHKAIFAIIKDLAKIGFDRDTIHSLLDGLPAAIEKDEDEHNGYDVHKDIDRILASISNTPESGNTDPDQGVFTDADPESESDIIAESVEAELRRREIKRTADRIEAERSFSPPPPDVSFSFAEGFENPPPEQRHLIEGIAGIKHNIMLIAQYKTGKTTFTVSNFCRSLCDGTPFLDQFAVPEEGRIVGHWNCEMDGQELLNDYGRPAGFQHPERMHVANLQGYGVNILSTTGRAWTVAWLRDRGVQVWTIDSLARLARMAGVNENDTSEMMSLFHAIDEIKVEAGVDVSLIIAHTGRAQQEEGNERARGSTTIDDWADARWVLTQDKGIRFLSVNGRGVELRESGLKFDKDTNRLTLVGGDRSNSVSEVAEEVVIKTVRENPGINKSNLIKLVTPQMPQGMRSAQFVTQVIAEVIDLEFVEIRNGAKREKTHWIKEDRGMAKVIDFRNVGDGPRERRGRGSGIDAVRKAGR